MASEIVVQVNPVEDEGKTAPLDLYKHRAEIQKLIETEVLDGSTEFGADVASPRERRFIIPVSHPFRNYWDVVIILAMVFTAVVTPFEVAFLPPVISALFVINRFMDFIFLTDMGITLMTPVMDEEKGVWIFSHWGIFKKYARFWFWIDLLTVIPFDAISVALEASGAHVGNLQGIRLLRLLRLIKLARVVRAARIIKRREAEMNIKYSTLTVLKFILIIIMLTHWVSCLMGLLPDVEAASCDFLSDDEITNGTVPFNWYTVYFTGLRGFDCNQVNVWSIYLAGCYYAAMTLSTIGYGDVTPKTDVERGVVIVIMLLGATFYAYAVGNICSIVQNMDKVRNEFKQDCDEFANFLDAQRFPTQMKRRLKNYLHFTWTKRKAVHHRQLLENLSEALRKEIAFELSRKWVSGIPFISEAITPPASGEYDDLLQEISLKLQPEAYPAQETLVSKGDIVDRLLVIERGTVFAHTHDLRDKKEGARRTSMVDGGVHVISSFGAEMIIDSYSSPVFVTCATDVDALVLSKAELFEILERFPVTRANIRMLSSRKNWEKFKTRLEQGVDAGAAFDPEENEREVVSQIIQLNSEIKSLSDQLYSMEESLALKAELLKMAKGT
jgi:CRP-like cAMP-binding protein